ncbi:DUF397 domain-containing protein [Streptomyces sp. NPDC001941]|uniref:DUF397 domain-containing protein n=1 Tax=Streptomyces sp. NPDC001941 TaxID=3154659 RepID=UPI00332786B6
MTDHQPITTSLDFAPEEAWFHASASDQGGGNCVDVAFNDSRVGVRDSKRKDGPAFAVTPAAWAAFVGFSSSQA